jgi:hypothetical protein
MMGCFATALQKPVPGHGGERNGILAYTDSSAGTASFCLVAEIPDNGKKSDNFVAMVEILEVFSGLGLEVLGKDEAYDSLSNLAEEYWELSQLAVDTETDANLPVSNKSAWLRK